MTPSRKGRLFVKNESYIRKKILAWSEYKSNGVAEQRDWSKLKKRLPQHCLPLLIPFRILKAPCLSRQYPHMKQLRNFIGYICIVPRPLTRGFR